MKKAILSILAVFFSITLFAQIRLPKYVSDGLVLQRDKENILWGWAAPKEEISLVFNKKTYKTTSNEVGKWEIKLPPQVAGGPFEMNFKGSNELIIKDILFGDVWICAGQSNMVIPMERVKEKYPDEVANDNYPQIRNLFIPTFTSLTGPKEDIQNISWKSAAGKDLLSFGAVSYFFAKELYQKYKVPIGIINSSVGGTPIEAWISEDGFKSFPEISKSIQKNKDTSYVNSFRRNFVPITKPEIKDLGTLEKWENPNLVLNGWRKINIPGFWEDQGLKDLNGVVWYRKEIEVPENMTTTSAKIMMGRIVDADVMYLNGKQIGNITYQYPPRRYEIPQGLLKSGKNTLVIKVINIAGKGGFVPDKPYFLTANGQTLDLKGDWLYKVGEVYKPFSGFSGAVFSAQNQPSALFNAMVAPFTKLSIKGFIWYQGESNTGSPESYDNYLPALINDWRKLWNQGDLPFLTVQLANFQDIDFLPTDSNWARLREAQLKSLTLPNTALAVTIDLGEWNDIHPLNKKDIGTRLSLAARNLAYNESNLTYSGPILKNSIIENGKIILTFDHVGNGITSKDKEDLRWFSIADYDKKFVWAKTKIVGKDKIEVWNDAVKSPKYVRYAWSDNPEGVNFYNQDGLPASPFRTDIENLDNSKPWMGKKCAVVLTYDDALNVHLDNAIPLLDSLNLKGTFYLTASSQAGSTRINDWRKAAQNGHELGNHTLYHPCDATQEGMSWVKPEYDLSKYTLKRIVDEVRMCNTYLKSIDGKDKRTFAFTCGHKKVIEGEFMSSLENDFIAARAVRHEMHPFNEVKLMDVDCYGINGETGEQMIELVKKAQKSGSLLVFLFHGVGGEHGLNVSLPAHCELLNYLKQNEKEIWTATMLDVAEHIKAIRN
jgi:sialate O-acetylesterase